LGDADIFKKVIGQGVRDVSSVEFCTEMLVIETVAVGGLAQAEESKSQDWHDNKVQSRRYAVSRLFWTRGQDQVT
jgi:hypothetical protein